MSLSNSAYLNINESEKHQAVNKAHIRLFEKTNEKYHLILPLLLLPFLLLGHYFGWGSTPGEQLLINMTCAIFLISTLHLGFTLANMMAFPEFRNFINTKSHHRPLLQWGKWLMIYLFFIAIGLFSYRFIIEFTQLNYTTVLSLYFGIYLFSSRTHTLMQTKGLLKIYNYKIKNLINGGHVIDEDLKKQKREVVLIYLTTALCGVQAFMYSFNPKSPGLKNYEIISIFIGCILVGLLFWNSLTQKGTNQSSKKSYLLRMLYYPITPISGFATLATEVLHGIEYLYVTREMRANSKMKSNKLWYILLFIFCSFVSITWFLSSHQALVKLLYKDDLASIPAIFVVFSAVNVSNAFFHFYLDSVIFKFREPIIGKEIGPLLSGMKTMKDL